MIGWAGCNGALCLWCDIASLICSTWVITLTYESFTPQINQCQCESARYCTICWWTNFVGCCSKFSSAFPSGPSSSPSFHVHFVQINPEENLISISALFTFSSVTVYFFNIILPKRPKFVLINFFRTTGVFT